MRPKKIKIFLIEDDPFLSRLYTEKFDLEGFEVVQSGIGEGALDLARKTEPDIILLDLILPHKDGFSVLEELKGDDQLKSRPVIVLTNLGEKEYVNRALKLGASDYLVKANFLPSEIVKRVKQLIP